MNMQTYNISVYYQCSVDRTSWPINRIFEVMAESEEAALLKAAKSVYDEEIKEDEEARTWEEFLGYVDLLKKDDAHPDDFNEEEGWVFKVCYKIIL